MQPIYGTRTHVCVNVALVAVFDSA